MADFHTADIDEPTKVMLEFCVAVTLTPSKMTRQWIERLRAHGFDDRAIHDMTQVAAYFNYINRIADALGVEPEDFMSSRPQANEPADSSPAE